MPDVKILAERTLALITIDAGLSGQVGRRGEDHAALGSGDDLGRVKRKRSSRAERAGMPALERRAVGMRRVLDQRHAPVKAQQSQLIGIRRDQSGDVHEDDRGRVGNKCPLKGFGAQRERRGVHVGEDRPAPALMTAAAVA